LSKIEDFGVHARQYYPLEVTYFKSSLDGHLVDLLWRTHWAHALSASPLLAGRAFAAGQIADVAEKLAAAEGSLAQGMARARYATALGAGGGGGGLGVMGGGKGKGGEGGGSKEGGGGGGKEGGGGGGASGSGGAGTSKDGGGAAPPPLSTGGPLHKICRDATRLSAEQVKGLASQVVKQLLFNAPPTRAMRTRRRMAGAPAVVEEAGGGGGGGGAVVAMES
jgi:COP9 signalosome complex subunit 5